MIKNRIILLIVSITFIFAGCSVFGEADPEEQSNAYFVAFKALYDTDTALNSGKYLALDLSNVMLTDTEPLISLMQGFCDDNGYILMLDTREGLKAKGYITALEFSDGFLITFEDVELKNNSLITKVAKWRTITGAVGAEYTVKKNSASWEITEISSQWIS